MNNINHPQHYQGQGLEVIDAMAALFGNEATMYFCHLNAFKYLCRCNRKHSSPLADLEKAKWYIDKQMELYRKLCPLVDGQPTPAALQGFADDVADLEHSFELLKSKQQCKP